MPIFHGIASAFLRKNGALPQNLNISRQTESLYRGQVFRSCLRHIAEITDIRICNLPFCMYTPHGGVYSLCLKLHMIRIRERGPLPYNRESDSPVGEGFPLPNFVFVIFILHFALYILHLHSARRSVPHILR